MHVLLGWQRLWARLWVKPARSGGWTGALVRSCSLGKCRLWALWALWFWESLFWWREEKRRLYLPIPFLLLFFFFPQYNVVKKWLEVDIAPDIRGRIPLLLTSLSFKVSVPETPGEETPAPWVQLSVWCVLTVGTGNCTVGDTYCADLNAVVLDKWQAFPQTSEEFSCPSRFWNIQIRSSGLARPWRPPWLAQIPPRPSCVFHS